MRFSLHAPSDSPQQSSPWHWRDYWVKHCLAQGLAGLGHELAYAEADADIWIFGWPPHSIEAERANYLWLISHPEVVLKNSKMIGETFKHIFCASKRFIDTLGELDIVNVTYLPCPPPTRPKPPALEGHEYKKELAFVGNANPQKNRPDLIQSLARHDSIVWGEGWSDSLDQEKVGGLYYPFRGLPDVWNTARVVPYTHHEEMKKHGFVADAALDVLVNSNALLISDDNPGWDDLRLSAVPRFKDTADLALQIKEYLRDDGEREGRIKHIRRGLEHLPNYKAVAQHIAEVIEG